MTQHWTKFVVVGRAEFPWDMLRFDACWPVTTTDAMSLPNHPDLRGDRYVFLWHIDDWRGWRPTSDRWGSFGWNAVVEPVLGFLGERGDPLWERAVESRRP